MMLNQEQYKKKRVYIQKMYFGKKYAGNLVEYFDGIYENFKNKKYKEIPELELNERKIYISAIEKRSISPDDIVDGKIYEANLYALNISCINLSEEITYGNIDKEIDERRTIVEPQDNEEKSHIGPLIDTQIVIYPNRGIICTCRGINRLSKWHLQKFLKKLLDVPTVQFHAIINQKGVSDLKKFDVISEMEYVIASPDRFSDYRDESTPEMADLRYGSYLGGKKIRVSVTDPSKKNILSKVKKLLSSQEEITKIKISGINDGIEDSMDLVRNLLIYDGNLKFFDKETPKAYFDLLFYACEVKRKNLNEFWTLK